MPSKILQVEISRFRGIPKPVALDLRGPSGAAASLLLAGDNGTGKSSVVDAIEFGLQGKLPPGGSSRASQRPIAVSLAYREPGRVALALDDGSQLDRAISLTGSGRARYDRKPHPSFSSFPIVLRRRDILRFWDAPEESRQVIFFDYFRAVTRAALGSEPKDLDELEEMRIKLKQARREKVRSLATAIKIQESDVPLSS
jgi:hypothetical protein